MNDIRLNLGKICQIKVNKNNGPWVCTGTVLVTSQEDPCSPRHGLAPAKYSNVPSAAQQEVMQQPWWTKIKF